MMCPLAVLFFVSTALAATTPPTQEKVHVTVYYESLCPDSKKFIFEQLKPVYTSFSKYMNVTLIPFGKSTYSKTAEGMYNFSCNHGEAECYGNKVQACALKFVQMDKQVDYIACLMSMANKNSSSNSSYPGNNCAHSQGIDYSPIEGCVESNTGSELLASYGDKTTQFQNPIKHVPTIVFNDQYMMPEDELAQKNFKAALCSKIMGSKPAECSPGNSAITFNAGFLPIMIVSTVTILSRL